jgi:hypothetical protein
VEDALHSNFMTLIPMIAPSAHSGKAKTLRQKPVLSALINRYITRLLRFAFRAK